MRDGWAAKLASLLTSAAAVAALWFTAQSLHATQNQIGLSEQGQLTDRFGKAVEQLGSDKLDVRLGGIYALERLARDSPGDHPTVIEVLSAFIRVHATITTTTACPTQTGRSVTRAATWSSTDIQAAVTVIGRRNPQNDGPSHLNLADTCLAGANLIDANLTHADLTGADLTGAILYRANLTDADLTQANLSHAYLDGANLYRANLRGVVRVN